MPTLIWNGPIHCSKKKLLKLITSINIEKITEYLTETYFNKYLFVGIKGKEVYIFVNRTPTDEELEELSFKIEDFI